MIKLRKLYALDEKDELLIRLLSKNSRTTLTALAEPMGITRVAIGDRLRKLEEAGIIKAYTVVVDWDLVAEGDEIERGFEEYGEDQSYYQET